MSHKLLRIELTYNADKNKVRFRFGPSIDKSKIKEHSPYAIELQIRRTSKEANPAALRLIRIAAGFFLWGISGPCIQNRLTRSVPCGRQRFTSLNTIRYSFHIIPKGAAA